MYKNINVLNKIMLSASVVCLCVAVYLACGFGTGAFVKCLPVLAAPVFLCALIAIYTPPVKTRTAVIASALCAAAAVAIIIAVAVNFFPAAV